MALQLWDLILCLCPGLFVGGTFPPLSVSETGLQWGLLRLVWLSSTLQVCSRATSTSMPGFFRVCRGQTQAIVLAAQQAVY